MKMEVKRRRMASGELQGREGEVGLLHRQDVEGDVGGGVGGLQVRPVGEVPGPDTQHECIVRW